MNNVPDKLLWLIFLISDLEHCSDIAEDRARVSQPSQTTTAPLPPHVVLLRFASSSGLAKSSAVCPFVSSRGLPAVTHTGFSIVFIKQKCGPDGIMRIRICIGLVLAANRLKDALAGTVAQTLVLEFP